MFIPELVRSKLDLVFAVGVELLINSLPINGQLFANSTTTTPMRPLSFPFLVDDITELEYEPDSIYVRKDDIQYVLRTPRNGIQWFSTTSNLVRHCALETLLVDVIFVFIWCRC